MTTGQDGGHKLSRYDDRHDRRTDYVSHERWMTHYKATLLGSLEKIAASGRTAGTTGLEEEMLYMYLIYFFFFRKKRK